MVPPDADGRAVDLGAGVGTVAFCVAARAPGLHVTGVERDPVLVGCAEAALRLPQNAAFADRVGMVVADIGAIGGGGALPDLPLRAADWVLMNPPFDLLGRVREPGDP